MKSGMIYLYYKDGERAGARRYDSETARKKIIKAWEQQYAKQYKHCYLQIAPDTRDDLINDSGENKFQKREKTSGYLEVQKNTRLTNYS